MRAKGGVNSKYGIFYEYLPKRSEKIHIPLYLTPFVKLKEWLNNRCQEAFENRNKVWNEVIRYNIREVIFGDMMRRNYEKKIATKW